MQKIDRAFSDDLVGQISVAASYISRLRARCRMEGRRLNRAIESLGLLVWLRTQLFGEHTPTYLVLPLGRGILPAHGIQPHQGAVGRFVVRLAAEPESRQFDAALPVSKALIGGGKQHQDAEILRAQLFPREKLPLIEHWAVR